MSSPTALTHLSDGTTEALDLIICCDRNFLSGFANLDGDAQAALLYKQALSYCPGEVGRERDLPFPKNNYAVPCKLWKGN